MTIIYKIPIFTKPDLSSSELPVYKYSCRVSTFIAELSGTNVALIIISPVNFDGSRISEFYQQKLVIRLISRSYFFKNLSINYAVSNTFLIARKQTARAGFKQEIYKKK